MTIGRTTAGAIKIKTEGNAGLRAVSCGCCAPPCNLFPASDYQRYFYSSDNLPSEIYIGGTRQFSTQTFSPLYVRVGNYETGSGSPGPLTGQIFGGVSGGTLLSRSGTGYGNTTNGVMLEPNLSSGYTWAIYKNGVRSVADYLIDGINRHDNYATTYNVNINGLYWEGYDGQYTYVRTGCQWWVPAHYNPLQIVYDDHWAAYYRLPATAICGGVDCYYLEVSINFMPSWFSFNSGAISMYPSSLFIKSDGGGFLADNRDATPYSIISVTKFVSACGECIGTGFFANGEFAEYVSLVRDDTKLGNVNGIYRNEFYEITVS